MVSSAVSSCLGGVVRLWVDVLRNVKWDRGWKAWKFFSTGLLTFSVVDYDMSHCFQVV